MIRPRDIYRTCTKEQIIDYLKRNRLQIIAFREPQRGERYLTWRGSGTAIYYGPSGLISGPPQRLIVKYHTTN